MKITRDVVRSFIIGQLYEGRKTLYDLSENFCDCFDFLLCDENPQKAIGTENARHLLF